MSYVLTLEDLDLDCIEILNKAASYRPALVDLLRVMYNTGCREGEVLDRERWSILDPSTYSLLPQKGNAPRAIAVDLLPKGFQEWLASKGFPYALSSSTNLRRVVENYTAYPNAMVGDKAIATHRFRHRYIKSLSADGMSDTAIKVVMGLSSVKVVAGYVGSQIIV